jgi:hypothetical protein
MKDKEIAVLIKSLQASYDESQQELDALKKTTGDGARRRSSNHQIAYRPERAEVYR